MVTAVQFEFQSYHRLCKFSATNTPGSDGMPVWQSTPTNRSPSLMPFTHAAMRGAEG